MEIVDFQEDRYGHMPEDLPWEVFWIKYVGDQKNSKLKNLVIKL